MIIDIKFLHGYFTGSTIDPIYDHSFYEPSEEINLGYVGINGNGDKFNYILQNDSTLTWESRVDTFYNRLVDMGATLVRLEAFWNKMCPPLTIPAEIDPSLRASMITDSLIDDYRNNKMDFSNIKYLLDMAEVKNMTPYVILGVGHKDRPIKYIDGDSITKIIAPGIVRGDNPEISESGTDTVHYIGVADSVYLYWLSLYTSAVVRELKSYTVDNLNLWQLENELNAARFAESFEWWRKGDSWHDESTDGFQDRVLRTLYNAVVNEYGSRDSVKLVQDFHLFNAEKRIREWRHYYDIVGLNFYPNQLHAYPLLGFMTGEFVWAARRILKRMGDQDKPVWLIETGYGSDRLAGEEVPEDFNDNTQFYGQERQADYLEDAFRTSRQYGAEAIGWYLMAFREEEGNENNLDEINNYIGLYDKNGNPKKAQYRFAEVTEQIYGSDSVTFANKYNETTIGGYQKLLNTMNSLKSPSVLKLGSASDYDVKCDQFVDYIVGVDTTNLQHQFWNTDITEFRLKHNFYSTDNFRRQEAKFDNPLICTFDMNIPNPNESELIKMIEVSDPWLVDASGYQSEEFYSLRTVTDSDLYPFFLFIEIISGNPYYKIRAPYVVFSGDSIHIFYDWAATGVNLQSDGDAPGEPHQQTAYFTDNATIQAQYYTNLIANIGKVYYDGNGVVKIQAPEYIADSIAIHRFSEWTTSTPGIVQFGNTNDFHTQLTITGSNARIEATYENAFELEEDIVLNQNLYIPPGSDYEIPENKKIISNIGYLELDGTRERPIRIKQGGSIFLPKSSSTKYWGGIKVNGGKLSIKNVVIENAEIGIDAIIPSPYVGPYKIQNCTFANNQKAIKYVEPDNQYIFSETAYIDISNCIFYNNSDLDIHMYVEYRAYSCDTVAYNRFYPYKGSQSAHFLKTINGVSFCVDEFNNLFGTNPQFADAENGDYHLTGSSPFINTGAPYIEQDPDNSTADIGAHYYPQIQGNISEDMIFSSEVKFLGNVLIEPGVQVTIMPGTRVLMGSDLSFSINGKLISNGSSENPIIYTSVYENPSTSEYWKWIRFNDTADNESIIRNSIIEYGDYGVYTYLADISLEKNEIRNIRYYGIYGYKSDLNILDNYIHDIGYYGIYLNNNNYISGQTFISGSHIEDAQRGIYLYRSSPKLYDNEINNCSYGLYCYYYSSAKLGWIGEIGRNHIHHNGRGVYAYKSSPFMGQSMCTINGGYNKIENSSSYQVEAKSYSSITTEANWWASSYNFYQDGTSYVDYYPYLSQPPFSKLISKSPEESAYDMAFRKVVLSDTNLTDEKVMESFNHTWPIKRKLNFARNLNFLGFPHLVDNICRDVINNNPDSSEAYLAIDLLWDSGRMTDDDFVNFKTYLDSLSLEGDEEEIYEEAEMISDGFMTEQSLAKRSTSYYLKFKSPEIASQALLDLFINALLVENDYVLAAQIYNRLKSEFPSSQAILEAINHLGIIQDNFDLPEELIIPDKYELLGNYPNPFNPYTHIKFSIPKISSVEVQIFNILGQKARTLRVDPILPGIYKITWDGKNGNGIPMSSGTYIYRIKAESLTGDGEKFVKSSKMVLLK